MTIISPPRHIVWSTDRVDLADPFQRKWYIRQVIEYGRAEDIASLDLDEVAALLDELDLPEHLYSLWSRFLARRANSQA
ncbi:MAG: hypothetical protein RMN53_14660 [Anaerolineae bacterium]|nr:hypothetical protein [Anaerolineae bacterium]